MSKENNSTKNKDDKKFQLKEKPDPQNTEKRIIIGKIIANIIFSLTLILDFFIIWTEYAPAWKIFFFLDIWSFWSNTFYIISITIIDICLYKNKKWVESFNNLLRNDIIRIIFPFSIGTVFIYWELVLLGDNYQGIGKSVLDVCKSFFMHGLVLSFVVFDLLTSKHINKNTKAIRDLIIISFITLLHFIFVYIAKKKLKIHPYDFLVMCTKRQMAASFIIIYILILNGYIILYLISENCFHQEKKNLQNSESMNNLNCVKVDVQQKKGVKFQVPVQKSEIQVVKEVNNEEEEKECENRNDEEKEEVKECENRNEQIEAPKCDEEEKRTQKIEQQKTVKYTTLSEIRKKLFYSKKKNIRIQK